MSQVVLARRLNAQTRREQILDVAAKLFVERGFEAVGMADIAAELQVSRPTIYSYFASTEMMLESLFEARLEHFPERLSPLLPESGVVSFDRLFRMLLEERELLSLINSGGGPLFRRRRRAFVQAIESRLRLHELPAVRREPHLLPILLNLLISLAYERVSAGESTEDGPARSPEQLYSGRHRGHQRPRLSPPQRTKSPFCSQPETDTLRLYLPGLYSRHERFFSCVCSSPAAPASRSAAVGHARPGLHHPQPQPQRQSQRPGPDHAAVPGAAPARRRGAQRQRTGRAAGRHPRQPDRHP